MRIDEFLLPIQLSMNSSLKEHFRVVVILCIIGQGKQAIFFFIAIAGWLIKRRTYSISISSMLHASVPCFSFTWMILRDDGCKVRANIHSRIYVLIHDVLRGILTAQRFLSAEFSSIIFILRFCFVSDRKHINAETGPTRIDHAFIRCCCKPRARRNNRSQFDYPGIPSEYISACAAGDCP